MSFSGYNATGSRYMISLAHCYDAGAVVTQGEAAPARGDSSSAIRQRDLQRVAVRCRRREGLRGVAQLLARPEWHLSLHHDELLHYHVGYYAEPSHTGDLPLHPWPDLTSDTRCGDSEVRYQDGEGSLKRMFRVDVCGSGGDSGGPYYTRWEDATPSPTTPARRAFGIHHGGNTLACSDPADKSLAAHIGPTQQGIEVTVDVTA